MMHMMHITNEKLSAYKYTSKFYKREDPETIMKRINTPQSLHSGFQTQKIF